MTHDLIKSNLKRECPAGQTPAKILFQIENDNLSTKNGEIYRIVQSIEGASPLKLKNDTAKMVNTINNFEFSPQNCNIMRNSEQFRIVFIVLKPIYQTVFIDSR